VALAWAVAVPELDRSRQAAAAPTDGQRILTTEFPLDAIGPTMADGLLASA
jgi:hypothetical protein